jgi:serine/threonine-protein kinase
MTSQESNSIEIQRRIHIGRLLGKGGMAHVVDGFDSALGQYLAVKQLLPEFIKNPEAQARFEEEASIMAAIDHPGVLPVYGMGTDADRGLYYVMKKVEGKTLEQIIADPQEPVTSVQRRTRLLAMLLDVCETVASAHEKGIIHRDIKPANILVDRDESVYVIDWGIAKRSGSAGSASTFEHTLSGKIMGTPGYMAPEQAEGRSARAGAEADVFALGSILYEILTAKRPFAADDNRAEMLGSIYQEPEHPRRVNVLIPRDINAVCLKALNKDPAARYPNARGLADDLRAHLEGRPVTAIRPNLMERARYASRRRPMRALIAGSSLLALGLVTAFIINQRWIDHQIADKAMERLEIMDAERAELDREAKVLNLLLEDHDLPEAERARITHELDIIDARWLLGQFEALRVLTSVGDLRFIQTDSHIRPLARKRMISVIETAIERGRPALAEAMIDTLLEREEEETLTDPLTTEDIQLLEHLDYKVTRIRNLRHH